MGVKLYPSICIACMAFHVDEITKKNRKIEDLLPKIYV
jgi:hypothetical protein